MLAHPAKLWRIDTNSTGRWVSDQNEPAKPVLFPSWSRSMHVINPTNPRGALDNGIEDRLHIGRRAANNAEHLGRCRLMFQRLA